MVQYNNFESLKANEIEGTDYRINLKKRDPDILIMAPHGGDIEPTTSKIADFISGEDYSLYTFEGLKASEEENNKLHIESHLFDEPQALAIVKSAKIVVTIHGQEDQIEEFVMVGGLHRALMSIIQTELSAMCFITKPPTQKYLGNKPQNICNRGTLKQGVQLEISRKLRNRLNEDGNYLRVFTGTIRSAIFSYITSVGEVPVKPSNVRDFYLEVIGCPFQKECALHGALNLINTEAHTPRWFYGDYNIHKDILVVASNPGRLDERYLKDYINILQQNPEGPARYEQLYCKQRELAEKHFTLCKDRFHSKLMKAISGILSVDWEKKDELFARYINYTNVVKCSTCCNFGVLFPKFKKFLAQKCIENHLARELRILQPKIIILFIDQKSMEDVIIPILKPYLPNIGLDDSRIIKLYRPSSVKDVQIEDITRAKTQYINILDRLKPIP